MTNRIFPRLSPLAAALALSLSVSATYAYAQETPGNGPAQAKDLDTLEVRGERALKASSPKYTEPLLDTPQTITVVTRETMDQQGLLSLKDVLSTLPGITFGAGEGGGGYGDSINLRGFSANNDITLDGVRDSAQYSRSDSFNLESIELVNGANSVYSGAGSVGGNINQVSKVAREGDSHVFSLGGGTDGYGRVTADSNFDLDDGLAVRLNAMGHVEDVPGRDEEFRHRWGFAPSVAFGLGSDTRLSLSYLHQHDNNLPQYGVPYALNDVNDGPLPGVDPETYFGYRNTSRQQIEVDALTAVFEHDFNADLGLRSLARLQKVTQDLSVTALQGSWCRFDDTSPFTGEPCSGQPAGSWNPNGGPRGNVRNTGNFIAYSQTDLSTRFTTGAIDHDLVLGVSFSKEDFDLVSGNIFRNPDGSQTGITYPIQDLRDPYNIWTGPVNFTPASSSKGSLSNQAVYAFDTLKFSERWMLSLGARYEHNEGDNASYPAPGTTAAITRFENEDDLFSYRAGLVFKPVQNASVYLAYANSATPSKASVSSACNATNCNVDPEEARNLELGTKWDVLDQKLSLTAALFRNERTDYRLPSEDPLEPEQVLDGESRVDGLALGVAGAITDHWSIFANYTFLDGEQLQSVSDFCLANPGSEGCDNSAGEPDPGRGDPLPNIPEHAASAWTTYALDAWTFGYGVTYQGGFYPGATSAAAGFETPSYFVHGAMVGFQPNARFGLQLNLQNLTDKEYYLGIRNNATNGWAIPGDGRSAVLTATFRY